MSNVKRVSIRGWMPYDGVNDEVLKFLGQCNLPAFGLRITYKAYSETIGEVVKCVSNDHGGQTTCYAFCIEGEEAIRTEYLQRICRLIHQSDGSIEFGVAYDIENEFHRCWDFKL